MGRKSYIMTSITALIVKQITPFIWNISECKHTRAHTPSYICKVKEYRKKEEEEETKWCSLLSSVLTEPAWRQLTLMASIFHRMNGCDIFVPMTNSIFLSVVVDKRQFLFFYQLAFSQRRSFHQKMCIYINIERNIFQMYMPKKLKTENTKMPMDD